VLNIMARFSVDSIDTAWLNPTELQKIPAGSNTLTSKSIFQV